MAKNDVLLIDGILESYSKGKDKGEKFENFSIEQVLKDYDLSDEELTSGIVDGKNDGGIDGIYFFVNSRLVNDDTTIIDPRSSIDLKIYVITCKHDDSFKMNPINNLATTLDEFFDLTIEDSELKSKYCNELIDRRKILKKLYKKVAPYLSNFQINLVYASRGNVSKELAENVIAKSKYLEEKIKDIFSDCSVNFSFIGSTELLEIYRKKKQLFSEIECIDIITCNDSYIAICNLKEYYKFLIDDEKKLKRYFLDSNVRAYMGNNRVNNDILDTLINKESTEFWFLNNGITILSDKVSLVGKTVYIDNVQIVNGLQTTETIYNFYSQQKGEFDENRKILIKIIVSNDKKVRDDIIKSTNNQTSVELYSLKATDKVQRDIEEILLKNDLYYERRTNYYLNQGIDKSKIFTPLYLAYGYISLVMKLPYKAVSLKAKFMNKPSQYELVFSEEIPLQVWPVIAKILRKVDCVIENNRDKWNKSASTNNLLKYMRNIISFLTISKIFHKFNFTIIELTKIDLEELTDELIIDTYEQVINRVKDYKNMRKKKDVLTLCEEFAKCNDIYDFEKISNRFNPFSVNKQYILTEEFIEKVRDNLPKQPWPVGTHTQVAKKIGEYTPKVSQAIHELILRGEFYEQKQGILYDLEGNVIKK